jgi:hypothetical protein
MRRQSDAWLLIPLLPIFFAGIFPMLLIAFLGFAGLGILGMLLICVGLAEGLEAHSNFNQQIIVHGHTRRSQRTTDALNLRTTVRFATLMNLTGVGLIVAGLLGFYCFG